MTVSSTECFIDNSFRFESVGYMSICKDLIYVSGVIRSILTRNGFQRWSGLGKGSEIILHVFDISAAGRFADPGMLLLRLLRSWQSECSMIMK